MSDDFASLWVGRWHGSRLVVFDVSLQPASDGLILLYFVQGMQLCARDRVKDKQHCRTERNHETCLFAGRQYLHWRSKQSDDFLQQRRLVNKVEQAPMPRRACVACQGAGSWHYQVGTFSEGAHSDGQQVIERCGACRGEAWVDNVYEL